jgi:hypothetical protein
MSICENDLNSLGSLSSGMPIPVSLTEISNMTVRSTAAAVAKGLVPSEEGLALLATAACFAFCAVDSLTALDRMVSIFASYMGLPEMEDAAVFVWAEFGTYRLILTSIWPALVN